MGVTIDAATDRHLWHTFDRAKEGLLSQFKDVQFDPATGVSVELLREEIRTFLAEHHGLPRVLQKAHAYRIVLARGQISIDPADWFVDKLDHGDLVREERNEWHREAKTGPLRAEAGWSDRMFELGVVRGGLDMSHISPGWERMLDRGLAGLIEDAQQARAALGSEATEDQLAFYEAVEIVYRAAIGLAERFSAVAARMALARPEHEARLRQIAEACARVPARRPETFHQALQFVWIMHEMIELEGEPVRSMGHFDKGLYPYYWADIAAGRLTREQAKELITFFWCKWAARHQGSHKGSRNKSFLLGGQHPDGADGANDLTYLALEAYEELNEPDPKIAVRFHPGSPDQLCRRVADMSRRGHATVPRQRRAQVGQR